MRSVRMAGYRPMSKGKILVVGAVMLVAIVGTSLQGALPASAATPTAPVLTATTPGDGQVVLDWTASDGGGSPITGYNILQGTSTGGEVLLTTVLNVLTYTDSPLTNGTYYYEVQAVNMDGTSVVSNEVSAMPTFTVTFDSNGGTGTLAPQTETGPAALTLNSFTNTGYTFTGWNTASGGGGTAYGDGGTFPFTASLTLYAQWTINQYTVTFNANGGTGSMSNETE